TLAPAAEHLHLVGDDVGEVFLDAVLPGELVVADRTFDVDLPALLQVLAGDLAELAEQLDPVPLGALLGIAVAVLAHAGGGQAERGHGHAALGVLGLGIVAEVADEDHLVYATCHEFGPVVSRKAPRRGERQASIPTPSRPPDPESTPASGRNPASPDGGFEQGRAPGQPPIIPGPPARVTPCTPAPRPAAATACPTSSRWRGQTWTRSTD